MRQTIQNGIDVLLQNGAIYKHQRIGLVTNNAAITNQGEKSRVALLRNGFSLVKLFSPEHGMTTTGVDGTFQPNSKDVLTGLPIISLYCDKLMPDEKDLEDIDIVLFDIPDVGCRFYTYLWTMTYVMEACAANNKPFVLLDRPNPTGALIEKAEGPFLDETNCSSFIGRWKIPIKHTSTLGELALYFAQTRIKKLDIKIISMVGYKRHFTAIQDFTFIPTSPAILNITTAMIYPGMGLLEGVNINEGRGTLFPFQQFGAPWIDSPLLKDWLDIQSLPGTKWKIVQYKAATSPYINEYCNGLMCQITDVSLFCAVQTGLALLEALIKLYPKHLTERNYPTNVNPEGKNHLDRLLGIQKAFTKLQKGEKPVINISEKWKLMIAPFLLY